MKNVILYGAPAAGKGTQCELLVSNHGYKVISIGQVLRNQRNPETEIGRIIIETQDKGVLTPDDIVAKALMEELKKYDNVPLIIDGYPRNLNQAKLLDTIFDNYVVINIKVDYDVAMRRTLGRLTCSGCGKIYNIYNKKLTPKQDGICDICGGKLNKRSDNNEESFKTRFDVYMKNVEGVLDYYDNKKLLYVFDKTDTKELYESIKEVIKW